MADHEVVVKPKTVNKQYWKDLWGVTGSFFFRSTERTFSDIIINN